MSRMGNSTLWGKITVLIAVCGWCLSAQAKYDGGSGTEAEPFRIAAVSDWQELMATPADWASHFVLTGDLDLDGVLLSPVGNYSKKFTGVFDGNDYVIRNVDVNMPGSDCVGLFGHVGTDGQIKNLGVQDISVFGYRYVGGLVGDQWYATISNCYSSGSVGGISSVGGLVGHKSGTIINCHSSGSVSGTVYNVGGLVGYNSVGTVMNCYSSGSVSGTGYNVGGLLGLNYGSISNCYSTGDVNGVGNVGGLVGDSLYGTISSSFWDVNTSGWTTSDGGTGRTTSQMQDIDTFLEAGWDFMSETANGTCNFWQMPESGGYPVISTLHGYVPAEPLGGGTVEDPYVISDANELGTLWYRPSAHYVLGNDIDLAGISWIAPVVPSFSGVFDGNDHTLRNVDVNMPDGDYVGLLGYLGTNGQIKNLRMENVSILGRHYVGGLVGYNEFGTISNCYPTGSCSGDSGVGGLVGSNVGTISDCYATVNVPMGDYGSGIGGLVGYNGGAISNCYSTGFVNGSSGVGGLVGENYYGAISNCYSTGDVNGVGDVGGLVGNNGDCGAVPGGEGAVISNCYSTGSVSGGSGVGGLVGLNEDTISNCYSAGSVSGNDAVGGLVGAHCGEPPFGHGGEYSCFWDTQTSGLSTSAGGTPKTTAEMKTQSTFTSAGWDFIGEGVNGPNDVWTIDDGEDYPRFVWQVVRGFAGDEVDFGDYCLLAEYWRREDCESSDDCSGVDIDFSGAIDFTDLRALALHWLNGAE